MKAAMTKLSVVHCLIAVPGGSQEYRKSDEFRGNWRLWNDDVGRKSKQRTHGEEKMSSVETKV